MNTSQDILNKLPLAALIDMMAKSTKELTEAINNREINIASKQELVKLLQSIILSKRSEITPD